MSFSPTHSGGPRGLRRTFRAYVEQLVGAVPLSVASLSARLQADGPLEVLETCVLEAGGVRSAPPLPVAGEAVRWLEANGRELVLAIGPRHERSEFCRVFVERGLRSVLIFPVFGQGGLVGTLTVASDRPDAYTGRHLQLLRMMIRDLRSQFPTPLPAAPAAVRPQPAASPRPGAAPGEPARRGEAHIEADSLGRIAAWDDAAQGIFGWSRREVVGSFLTFFYRAKHRHLLDATVLDQLLAGGTFHGRALCYNSEGLPVTCEVELSELPAPGGTRAFRGCFRPVNPRTLLPREELEFGFARLFDFRNAVRGS